MRRGPRSTPPGQHRPVLLQEVLVALDPRPGQVIVDCTVGWGGHSAELLQRIGPSGFLLGFDLDCENLARSRERLTALGHPFHLQHGNFAGIAQVLAERGFAHADAVLADLGMSSMQVDDPERGFSYARDGALDMRMDRSRGRPLSQLLLTIEQAELARALRELGDEPEAERIAAAIVQACRQGPLERTGALARVIQEATGQQRWQLQPTPGRWNLHPAARSFQALRILVNRELSNLEHLLRILPHCLAEGGRAAFISFHSGEDRLVKSAFRTGLRAETYREISPEPIRASYEERGQNPRSRSAKLRWARR
jgi:16S rRNA (cytosine1402-N4)-methyltransferase